MKNILNIDFTWLINGDKNTVDRALLEFSYLSRNFVSWLSLIIANSKDDEIKQIILENLIEECGTHKEENHYQIYKNMLLEMSLNPDNYQASIITQKVVKDFYKIFKSPNSYRSLCVIGPSFERITSCFLLPLFEGCKKHYPNVNFYYFDIHLSEMEDKHADDLEKALGNLETKHTQKSQKKEEYLNLGMNLHEKFWQNIKNCN